MLHNVTKFNTVLQNVTTDSLSADISQNRVNCYTIIVW
jgi:hypothetical protein